KPPIYPLRLPASARNDADVVELWPWPGGAQAFNLLSRARDPGQPQAKLAPIDGSRRHVTVANDKHKERGAMHFGQFNLMGYRYRGASVGQIYDNTVEQVKAAEKAGFEASWFAEHHFSN